VIAPTDLNALTRAGAEALNRREPAAARSLFEKVTAARPSDISAWIGLALACRDLGDDARQIAALDRALAVNPGHLPALLMKADYFAKTGDGRAAKSFYRAAVDRAPPLETLSPQLRSEVARAERQAAQYVQTFDAHLHDAITAAGFDPANSSSRFAQSLDLLLGKKQLYLQQPRAFYFPELPQRQFYERAEFAWLAQLEARTDDIRDELLALAGDEEAFQPYIRSDSGRPPMDYGGLADNLDWSAFYLIKFGARVEAAAARCPRTMEALAAAPLFWSPGRTPSALFSRLRPGTRIPPHTGHTNACLICHLPLIVPPDCGLRVGNETRRWTPGETLIFDDSIEHEAWNGSDQQRVVLLFEIWRPELTADERTLVAATLSSVAAYDTARSAR
jgi:aspartate beta-hydroxylase